MARGVDFVDLPELHRKKLIRLPESNQEKVNVTSDGFFDLSQKSIIQPVEEQKQSFQTPSQTVPLGENNQVTNFFSDFASIGESNRQTTEKDQKEESETVKDLKWRIENLEYKIEQLTEKLNSLNKT